MAAMMVALSLTACQPAVQPDPQALDLADGPIPGKFVWHDLVTDDPRAAQRFYGGLFGWTFERSARPGGDAPYVLIRSEGRYVGGIVDVEDPRDGDYSRWLGYLSVPDVDAAVRATRRAGGEALAAPVNLGDRLRAAAVRDPQGALLGLVHSQAGDPADRPLRPGRVAWNELLAADDEAAAEFYAGLAAFRPETLARRGGRYIVLEASGQARAGIQQLPSPDAAPLWLTHFAVEDPTAAARQARALGGTVLLEPTPAVRDGAMAIVRDPNGAIFALTHLPTLQEGAP